MIQTTIRVCDVDGTDHHVEVCDVGGDAAVTLRLLHGDYPGDVVREVSLTPEAAREIAAALMKTADAVR